MAHVLDEPKGLRLKIRVDRYDRKTHNYGPTRRQAIIFTVGDAAEQWRMFQSLKAWGERRDWNDGVDMPATPPVEAAS